MLSEFSVKQYQFTLVVFIMLLGLGVNSLLNMPRAEDPEIYGPFYPIVVIYPGAGPEDLEELVVDPIEKRVNELDDIKEIKSSIGDGVAVIEVEYAYNTDRDEKYQELVREMNALQSGELPKEIISLEVRKVTPSDVNIIQVALLSETAPYHVLERQAELLEEQLEKIKQLKKIDLWGFPERLVRVTLNLEKMGQMGIPINNVLGAVQGENTNIPGGNLLIGQKKFNVKTSGSYESLEEIRNTIVYSNGATLYYLKDIAQVDFEYADETHITRLNGKRCVFITAALKSEQNISQVKKLYQPVVDAFAKKLPADIKLVHHFDQADGVNKRLSGLGRDLIIAIILVAFTLIPLGFRAASVVMISIPLCLAIGLALMDILGYTINQLSVVGFVVALGILVDDSIVVVENIERWMREGHSKLEAVIKGTKQITLAVIGSTATLILAFLPLVFLPEASGDFIRSLPMSVVTSVLASLFVSLTIVPFLSSRLLSSKENPEGNIFLRGLKRLIGGSYARLLDIALKYPRIALVVAALIFVGTLLLIPSVGFSLFPKSEKPQFLINIETENGSNIYQTDKVTRFVEGYVASLPEVKYVASNVGHGNPRVYYNVLSRNDDPAFSELFVQLAEMSPDEKGAIIDSLRVKFKQYPGAKIQIKDFEQGPPIEAPVAIRVFGENLDTLRKVSFGIENMIAGIPGTIYLDNPLRSQKTDLKIQINKDKANLMGVQTSEIDRTVRLAVSGLDMGTYSDDAGDDFIIRITTPKGLYSDLNVLDNLYVNSFSGASIPLRQLATIGLETSPTTINHFDKIRYNTITSQVQTGYLTNDINQRLIRELAEYPFPEGVSYQVAGEIESSQESFGGLGAIILITIFGFMAVLILEFKTFKSTLIVLSVIPLGLIGAILMLLISGNTFSFVAVVGLIALVGIEIKTSILLVDFTNQLRAEGKPLEQAIREAGETRFVPILLTAGTAIGGLIPLVIENNPLYSPLAWVIIGGLISSTLLARIVTPVLYKLLPPKVELLS